MRVRRLMLAVLVCATTSISAPAAAVAQAGTDGMLPRIQVQGNRFVDPSGSTVTLRGVSFSDPDRLAKQGQWNRRYFQAARDWNANLVRFPVHPSAWRERGEEGYLQLLDQGIEWAGELGMYVIIDWHTIGNLQTERFQAAMYNTTVEETFRFWTVIAQRYAGNPVVPFYELVNEPTNYRGRLGEIDWRAHREMMEALVARIREHAPAAIPLVAGFDWAYDLRPVRTDPIRAEGIAYVAHPYPQKRPQPWEAKWEEDFGFVADHYPIVATEFGFMSADGRGAHIPVIADEQYGHAVIDYFERKGISWTAWVFDPVWSPQLIENWDFEPTAQGRLFRDRMMTLNPDRN